MLDCCSHTDLSHIIRNTRRLILACAYRAVVLLLQQSGHVSANRHLLGQLLVLHTDPPPQLLQEDQQTGPALSTCLQMGSVNTHHALKILFNSKVGQVSRNIQIVGTYSIKNIY